MDDITLFIRCFVNLFAIVNPLGAFPVFVATTSGLSSTVRFRVGTVCAGTVVFVLVIALLIGQFILNFFGISISSFRTAGGIFICLLSLSMLKGSMTEARKEGQATAALEEEGAIGQAIVPLAIPILAGPGAISSVIVYSSQITHFHQWFVIGGAILLSLRLDPLADVLLGGLAAENPRPARDKYLNQGDGTYNDVARR